MKNIIKKISVFAIVILVLSEISMAANELNTEVSAIAKSDTISLISLAGRQRMLSQRIAKDYMYAGNKIATTKAKKELETALAEFLSIHDKLMNSINDEEIKNLLVFVQMNSEELDATVKKEFTADDAYLVLDLSESMLEGSQYLVDTLKNTINMNASKIVDNAGRQLMLSQRIAKYYIAYKSGIKDKNTVEQMHAAVKLFTESHEALMLNKTNTPEINRKLNEIDRLWKIVYKFYLNIEKGGLPLIVFSTTDKITTKMNEVTGLYVELYK